MKPSAAISSADIRRVSPAGVAQASDEIAIEEPLEIRIGTANGHRAVSITMRTPGSDDELAAGFLFTEGILSDRRQIRQILHCGKSANGSAATNTIRVDLADGVEVDVKNLERNFYATSSCGVCGKASIDALVTGVKELSGSGPIVTAATINSLSRSLRASQDVFERTGGLHASALFDSSGGLEMIREDVGRHNALDKLIGARFLSGELPLSQGILLVSGRVSFELVQKALMAGIPILAAVGAPSSLAVELAAEYGMTLLGFVRDERFNIYCGAERIDASAIRSAVVLSTD